MILLLVLIQNQNDFICYLNKEFEKKIDTLKSEGIYVGIETTIRGSKTLRLRTDEAFGKLDKSFPPNNASIKEIKRIINKLKN